MTRYSQSGDKTSRVSEVLTDPHSSLGGMLRRAGLLMQFEHLLSSDLDPELSGQFQVAAIHGNRVVLVSPGAAWATRLKMQSAQMIGSLRRAGYTDIDKIEIRVAPLVRPRPKPRRKKPLSPAALQALDAMSRLLDENE